MKKIFIIALILLACTSIFPAQSIDPLSNTRSLNERIQRVENGLIDPKTFVKKLESIFDLHLTKSLPEMNIFDRMKAYNVPGVSIAVINNFKLEWAKGYGVLESGNDNAVTTETLFQAASTSKPLATAIVLRLVEEGKFDLDEDVNIYLKSWKIKYDTIKNKVTLRLLITHKAGINRPGQGYSYEINSSPTLIQVLNGEPPAINDSFRFDHEPGTVYRYSNFGYMIIQLILEDYLKMPYKDIVQKYIFNVLKMKSSLMQYPFPDGIFLKLSKPHDKFGVPQEYGLHPSALGNAGLITTPSDLAKFAIELMLAYNGKSELILNQKSVEAIFTKQADIEPGEFSGFSQLGFGVFLMGEGEKKYFIHPGSNNSGTNCVLAASTSSGNGVIIMTNGLLGDYLSMELIASIVKEYSWHDVK